MLKAEVKTAICNTVNEELDVSEEACSSSSTAPARGGRIDIVGVKRISNSLPHRLTKPRVHRWSSATDRT